jgi:hypothetical protein
MGNPWQDELELMRYESMNGVYDSRMAGLAAAAAC